MIKSIIFDVDDTLYDFTSAHGAALHALTAFAEDALGLSAEAFVALHRETFRLQQARSGRTAASHNRLIRFQMMLETLKKPVALAPAMAELYWTALLARAKALPGAAETLTRLREMGMAIGVGTNMTANWQYAKLKRLGLMAYVDYIVTSEEAGVEKPAPGLFMLCAEKAGCSPGECAFVGDSLPSDALGARDAGMAAYWFNQSADPVDVLEGVTRIRAFSELPALLETV
jgi:putative hydrolase of the HAD superfamily